ncbi:MAG: DUF2252 domain-containing protein [Pedobacter sp.]|nr:MAG: DUF2252 domain-containing protein [Pedobacter sp.]
MPYVNQPQPNWKDEADRILAIQERMQNVTASLLGRTNFKDDCYVLQELQPMEDTFDFKMASGNYRNMLQAIDDMAILTASAQLRSGGMDGSATIDEAQNKDGKAIQLKLNELIAASRHASNRMVDIEDLTEEELDVLHQYYERLADKAEEEDDIHCSHSIDAAERQSHIKSAIEKRSSKRTVKTKN